MKTIGTLEEIGAQVGDTVEFIKGGRYGPHEHGVGQHATIPIRGNVFFEGLGEFTRSYDAVFRIVTRAAKSPVRTVTRKEIVPGAYGWVTVSDETADGVRIGFAVARMSKSDLTAAIATLTEIRDAMIAQEEAIE